ncbi:MAG TPA: hypothetical protein VF549_13985 [Solirubrobacteraceae bacterium]|jgi:hypothetical protein
MSGRRALVILIASVLAAAAAGALVGAAEPPPRGEQETAIVAAIALRPDVLEAVGIGTSFNRDAQGGVRFFPARRRAGGVFVADGTTAAEALRRAYAAAVAFADAQRRAQDRRLRQIFRTGGPPARAAARDLLLDPRRYMIAYDPAPPDRVDRLSAAGRGALPAALLALLAAALLTRRRPLHVASPLAAGLAGAIVAWSLAGTGADVYAGALGLLAFGGALAYVLGQGIRATRLTLALVVVLAAMRGGLLALANAIDLPHALLLVNTVQPALIGACAIWVLVEWRRGRALRFPRPLVVGAAVIAAVAVANVLTQQVGITLYGIGLAQYLVYPVFALACWTVLTPGDPQRLRWLLVALSAVVAASVLMQSAGVTAFAQASSGTSRAGGVTGSFLHASIFLGTLAPLWVALAVLSTRWARRVLAVAGLGLLLVALALTFGRAGFAIAAIAIATVSVSLRGPDLRRAALLLAAGLLLAVPLGIVSGAGPKKIGDRIASGFDWDGDQGNRERSRSMRLAVRRWRDAPLPQKALGEGLAATGNAKQLTDQRTDSTESYPLKLLVETGAVGALLLVAFLVWAGLIFLRTALSRSVDPLGRASAAGGFALTIDAALYPTLETQILGMTWWLLLVLALAPSGGGLRVRFDGLGLRAAEGVDPAVARATRHERDGELAGNRRA